MVTCPCCHGERVLYVYEPDHASCPRAPEVWRCEHCAGEGMIEAEVGEIILAEAAE